MFLKPSVLGNEKRAKDYKFPASCHCGEWEDDKKFGLLDFIKTCHLCDTYIPQSQEELHYHWETHHGGKIDFPKNLFSVDKKEFNLTEVFANKLALGPIDNNEWDTRQFDANYLQSLDMLYKEDLLGYDV